MTLALIPGSFDPVTCGHLDIIERAAAVFDEVLVAVIANPSKQPLFELDKRAELLEKSIAHLPNCRIDSFGGLLVDYAQDRGVDVVVKGLRAVSDFDYEIQMAQMNHRLADLDTYFLPTRSDWSYLSSSLVREIARLGGNIEGLVPTHVQVELEKKAT